MSSGFSGRGKRVPRATAPALDAAGRGCAASATSADWARGKRGCAYPTMRGAARGRIAPGSGAFDSAQGARAMHATGDGRGRDRHGPIGRLASSRTGHEAIGSEDATAGVCALGVRYLHAFSLHRVRTVLTAAPPVRQRSAELFPLKLFARHTTNGVKTARCFVGYEDGLHNAAMRCECIDARSQHLRCRIVAAAQLHQWRDMRSLVRARARRGLRCSLSTAHLLVVKICPSRI